MKFGEHERGARVAQGAAEFSHILVIYFSGAPSCAKRAWDRAPYSENMVNHFSFGCHVTDRAYVRTYASTDYTGRVGETIKRT